MAPRWRAIAVPHGVSRGVAGCRDIIARCRRGVTKVGQRREDRSKTGRREDARRVKDGKRGQRQADELKTGQDQGLRVNVDALLTHFVSTLPQGGDR